jgi:hypothetical protein
MYKITAISATLSATSIAPSLVDFIRDNYLDVLIAAKCACSSNPEVPVCPCTSRNFQNATKEGLLDLDELKDGLYSIESAIEENIDTLSKKDFLRSFFETLKTTLQKTYSTAEIEFHIASINCSLEALE